MSSRRQSQEGAAPFSDVKGADIFSDSFAPLIARAVDGLMAAPAVHTGAALRVHIELQALSEGIARMRKELSELRPTDLRHQELPRATDELDAVVDATEKATSDILEAMEKIEEQSQNMPPEMAESISDVVTGVYEACSFQDITGQRITKVVRTLKDIETRIDALLSVMGDEVPAARAMGDGRSRPDDASEAELLHGPGMPGNANEQTDIDRILAEMG